MDYIKPNIEIICFDDEEVLTKSGDVDDNGDGPGIVAPDNEV